MVKFPAQLTNPAMLMAVGLGPCVNNSAVINHGMDPGPTWKKATNKNTPAKEAPVSHDPPSTVRVI